MSLYVDSTTMHLSFHIILAESQQQQHHHNTDSNEAIVTPKLEFGRITPSSAFLNSYNSPDRGNGHLKWPGIEVLMEAYERHQQGQFGNWGNLLECPSVIACIEVLHLFIFFLMGGVFSLQTKNLKKRFC